MKIIELNETVTASNDRDAEALRLRLREAGTLLINVMSSPGSGKTTLISRLIRDLSDLRIGVLEADIESDLDARRIEALGASSIQVHTSGMCHMDAGMTAAAWEALSKTQTPPLHAQNLPFLQDTTVLGTVVDFNAVAAATQPQLASSSRGTGLMAGGGVVPSFDLLFLENVGNLICPAEYDTGAGLNLMLLSVPEGDDKPLKYPLMFQKSDALVITKTDALPYFDFDLNACTERARKLKPNIQIFPVSAKTGDGMPELERWLLGRLTAWRISP